MWRFFNYIIILFFILKYIIFFNTGNLLIISRETLPVTFELRQVLIFDQVNPKKHLQIAFKLFIREFQLFPHIQFTGGHILVYAELAWLIFVLSRNVFILFVQNFELCLIKDEFFKVVGLIQATEIGSTNVSGKMQIILQLIR